MSVNIMLFVAIVSGCIVQLLPWLWVREGLREHVMLATFCMGIVTLAGLTALISRISTEPTMLFFTGVMAFSVMFVANCGLALWYSRPQLAKARGVTRA